MIKTEPLQSVTPGNPFLSDAFHMGSQIGTNVIVMYAKHLSEKQDYMIVVNTLTGERVRISFVDQPEVGGGWNELIAKGLSGR